jgi:hypothetical protein
MHSGSDGNLPVNDIGADGDQPGGCDCDRWVVVVRTRHRLREVGGCASKGLDVAILLYERSIERSGEIG